MNATPPFIYISVKCLVRVRPIGYISVCLNGYIANWSNCPVLQALSPDNERAGIGGTQSPTDNASVDSICMDEQDSNDVAEPGPSAVQCTTQPPSVRKFKRKVQSIGCNEADLDVAITKANALLDKPSDAYSVFGEYIAMELRNMKADSNRKRLMSVIRHAVAYAVDEDDTMHMSTATLSSNSTHVDNSVGYSSNMQQ